MRFDPNIRTATLLLDAREGVSSQIDRTKQQERPGTMRRARRGRLRRSMSPRLKRRWRNF
ncbi:hypothetical protein MESS2_1190036 [Mesorhizobium metallidurans STM 2683]|uniref:Uncharacterized protein n=1 Tax=Mesorhizobium metallidurans STM 2683 TaxID=1297569 RepID=M5EWH7_9HYPH|nr:hypothetical protein MESS2_1190036 [Mesorhizobium metallidurans STM 2683]